MLIVTLLIVWAFIKVATATTKLLNQNISLDFVCSDVEVVDINDDIINQIESEIIDCYYSQYFDKRERIVMLLDKLAKYIDPGDFLEKFNFILPYIFDMNCG